MFTKLAFAVEVTCLQRVFTGEMGEGTLRMGCVVETFSWHFAGNMSDLSVALASRRVLLRKPSGRFVSVPRAAVEQVGQTSGPPG